MSATPRGQPSASTAETGASREWVVYIVRCADDSLYTGITNNLDRRLKQHNAGTASRYTRSRLPVELVYQESQPDKSAALKRELAIKKLSRSAKEQLIGIHREVSDE